jgi:hypothetical protein
LPDEFGDILMDKYFEDLGNEGTHESRVKIQWLVELMDDLAEIPKSALPEMGDKDGLSFDVEFVVDGINYERKVRAVKALGKSPIYELRANIPQLNWRFRATFFPKYKGSQLYYCFVFPFEKVDGEEDHLTDEYKERTYEIYKQVIANFGLFEEYFE